MTSASSHRNISEKSLNNHPLTTYIGVGLKRKRIQYHYERLNSQKCTTIPRNLKCNKKKYYEYFRYISDSSR